MILQNYPPTDEAGKVVYKKQNEYTHPCAYG